MVLCGCVLLFLGLLWIKCGKKLSKEKRQMAGILALAALLGGAEGISASRNAVILEGNRVERNEKGDGDYEEALRLWIGNCEERIDYVLKVPEQVLTGDEEKAYLAAAIEEIMAEFPGSNASAECIREQVVIRDSYQKGKVEAEWSFDNYEVMDFSGRVIEDALPDAGTPVRARVRLSCGETFAVEEFYFQVFSPMRSEQEALLYELDHFFAKQGKERGNAFLKLPEKVGKYPLTWQEKRNRMPEKILLFGGVLAGFVPLLEKSRRQEQEKKRKCLLELQYPDMVSRVALLLGAGMTLQGAWKRIAFSYEKRRKDNKAPEMPVYEEMLFTCREMENGVEEARAYSRFGERCALAVYRRFGNILGQNLRKGSRGIVELLEHEAEEAFEERKNVAKRYGEEAGTKLLFPMMLMLAVVMLILLIPAMAAFQI